MAEIVAAAAGAGADCVLLTDHDTLEAARRGEEGWRGGVLLLVGHEVSPKAGHLLVFGVDREIGHAGRTEREICTAVRAAGGIAFAAHPFSEGARMSKLIAPPHGWTLLDDAVCGGIELWSLSSDEAEAWRTPWEAAAFLRDPMRMLSGRPGAPPASCGTPCAGAAGCPPSAGSTPTRRASGSAGGCARRWPTRATSRCCRPTCSSRARRPASSPPTARPSTTRCARAAATWPSRRSRPAAASASGPSATTRAAPMGAQVDPGRWVLRATAPRRARLRLLRDGVPVHAAEGLRLEHAVAGEGCYRVEARLAEDPRERLWLVSNPVYVGPA